MANSNYFDFDTMHIFVLVFILRFSSSLDAIPIRARGVRYTYTTDATSAVAAYASVVVIAAVVFIVNDL